MISYAHGIFSAYGISYYRNSKTLIKDIPSSIVQFLYDTIRRLYVLRIEFTIGKDKDFYAVAVCHPLDNYNKKKGCSIVRHRIENAHKNPDYVERKGWITTLNDK